MATSVVPAMIDALVAAATAALPDVDVIDGLGRTNNIGDTLMVGVDDPDSSTSAFSGEASQRRATGGPPRSRDQDGSITCAALSWDGDSVQKTARDGAYAIQAAVENLLRTDPQVATALRFSSPPELGDERLSQNVYDDGCDALLVFTVKFTARI